MDGSAEGGLMRDKGKEARNRELAAKLGAATRRLREKRGLSLEELAARSGVEKGWLGKIERGTGAGTSVYGWYDIANALGLTLGEFFTVAFGKRMRRVPKAEDCPAT